jgi:uncharacterized membrane protein
MKRFEESTTINAPADKVFAYVSDFTRHGEWSGHRLQVTRTGGEGPVAVGSTYSTEAKQFGTQREQSTVTEVKQNASFVWESKGALGLVRHWFTVSGDGGSTTLSKGLELVQPSFLAKMMGWKIGKDSPKGLRSDVEKIKAKLESPA